MEVVLRGLTASGVLGVAAVVMLACDADTEPAPTPAPAPSRSAVPVDRLAKGELPPGTESIWGLPLPRGMSIIGRFPKAIHASGPIPPEDLANYVRDRVVVSRVELGPSRTIFPASRIKGGSRDRLYQIEIVERRRNGSILEVHDVTPAPKTEGLSNAKRLEQVGLTPDGKLIDPANLK